MINKEPFFTNDPQGAFRVLEVFGGLFVSLGGLLVVLVTRPWIRRIEVLEAESKRVNAEIRLTAVEGDVKLMKNDIDGLHDSYDAAADRMESLVRRLEDRDDRVVDRLSDLSERISSLEGALHTRLQQHRAGDSQQK